MKPKYAVVFEQTPNNYSAHVPDLPGCVSTAESWEDIQRMIREAITLHIEAMLEHGEPFPEPQMSLEEAEAYHNDVLAEYDEEALAEFGDVGSELPTKFGMVEVEIETPLSARAS